MSNEKRIKGRIGYELIRQSWILCTEYQGNMEPIQSNCCSQV